MEQINYCFWHNYNIGLLDSLESFEARNLMITGRISSEKEPIWGRFENLSQMAKKVLWISFWIAKLTQNCTYNHSMERHFLEEHDGEVEFPFWCVYGAQILKTLYVFFFSSSATTPLLILLQYNRQLIKTYLFSSSSWWSYRVKYG